MKNIYVIPTNKPSRLILQGSELLLSKYKEENEGFSEFNQHIYITSDEEIKDAKWIIHNGKIHEVIKNKGLYISVKELSHIDIRADLCKKIILTTDQSLDGIQAIDDEFLEWFVKNPSCEEVEVKDVFKSSPIGFGNAFDYYKIIIPKEEPKQEKDDSYIKEQKERRRKLFNLIDELEEKKLQEEPKQETLEEAAESLFNDFQKENQIIPKNDIRPYKLGFIQGAKWQQERMYSDMQEYAEFCIRCYEKGLPCIIAKDWFEQFKKK